METMCTGIAAAIQLRLSPYLIGNPDQLNEVQPKQARIIHVPEYFAEYRERGDRYAAFLGASLVAKVDTNSRPSDNARSDNNSAKIIFADPAGRNFVSKADYATRGPKAILEMSASLL